MQPVRVGVLGLGTVGSGVLNTLQRNCDEIARRAGREVEVVIAAVRQANKARECDTRRIKVTTDPQQVVLHPDVDVVLECMGGLEPAGELLQQAIAAGKHVVTANKQLLAEVGNELFAEAEKHNVCLAFEAAVGGGIPIIKALREGLAANRIEQVVGIINGTANFILTAMAETAQPFSETLAEAQALGYAEADPAFDVDGIDAAHKLTLLSALAFGTPLKFNDVFVEGISSLLPLDFIYAKQLGFIIKPLAITKRVQEGLELRVHPALLPQSQLLAHVNGVMNAVWVQGDTTGPTLYYGPGAGGDATASAMIADLIDVVRMLTSDPEQRVPYLAFQTNSLQDLSIVPSSQFECANYLRLWAEDKPGVMAEITQALAEQSISIEAILQKENVDLNGTVPVVILTHRVPEANLDRALAAINTMEAVHQDVLRLRIEECV